MISEGATASISLVVTDRDTAISLGSGDVAVLGTPRVVALCEEAAVAAIAGSIPGGATSVGTSVNIDHLSATAVGQTVTASATVTAVDGKRVAFSTIVKDGSGTVARGVHIRVVVDRGRFEASVVPNDA